MNCCRPCTLPGEHDGEKRGENYHKRTSQTDTGNLETNVLQGARPQWGAEGEGVGGEQRSGGRDEQEAKGGRRRSHDATPELMLGRDVRRGPR